MKFATAFLFLACGASAALPPRSFALAPLNDNGRSFITAEARLPLRCLDLPGLIWLPADEEGAALDRAAAAGFNAVSFEAPLYGPQGLSKSLGKVDAAQGQALGRILKDCEKRRLYAFPVLWTPAAVDALVGTLSAKTAFWGGKNCLGWQAWDLHELAKLSVGGQPLTRTAAVGGWLLYRGPWPGGSPLQGAAPEALTPSTEAWLRSWASWQVKLFHQAGFSQRLGLGFWAKQDLPLSIAPEAPVLSDGAKPVSPVAEPPPFAPLSDTSGTAQTSADQAQALDNLPPVPGLKLGSGEAAGDDDGDEPASGAAPQTPWDLEGLDWGRVDDLFAALPVSSQVDFLELSLETEDWYRVGDRLAETAAKAEVPVLWRQDWRTASRYERPKRLEAPAPLAGLVGPWPDDDWPADGETLWQPDSAGALQAPFNFKKMALKRQGRKILLSVELNKPASLIVRWGKAWPLDREVRNSGRPKAELSLALVGAAPGQWVLVQVKADTARAGGAMARARWMKAPQ